MAKLIAIAFVVVAPVDWLLTGTATGALLVYEPFDYQAAVALDNTPATGYNLAGAYTALGPTLPFMVVVESPGLDYGNLLGVPQARGNRLTQPSGSTAGGATVNVDQDIIVNHGEELYVSALFTFSDEENGNHLADIIFTNDENGDELSFGESAVGVRAIRVSADTAATGQIIAAGADRSFNNGDTLLLVCRYINSAAAGGDRMDLIGYDVTDADQLPATFDAADPNAEFAYSISNRDINLSKITSISFRIRGNDNNFIDELRIASTYESLVPEPSSVLLTMGSTAIIIWRRQARKTAGH